MVKIEGNEFPETYFFHRDHTWVKIEGNLARVGYNDWAQKAAGKLLSLKMKRPGAPLEAGKTLGSIESGKWVGSLKIPLSGELVQVNEEVLKTPSIVNTDPYGKGWIAVIKPNKIDTELNTLIPGTDKAALESWIIAEKTKAKV